MTKATRWHFYGNLPIYLFWCGWLIFVIVIGAWTALFLCLGIIIAFLIAYYWSKFCSEKELEAERE